MIQKVNRGFNLIIAFCLFIASIIVLVVSTFTTIYYDMHYDVDWPQYGKENIPLLLILVAAVFAILFLLHKKQVFEKDRLLLVISLLFILGYCMMLIISITPQAVNDSKLIDDVINQFAQGDYSSLTGAGGYLYTWPFQLGYVGFGQVMYSLFGPSNYFAWDIVQLISVIATVFMLNRITWELFEDKMICGIMACLSCGALFFYNYVTYIYGDILSMAPQTLALYMMILYLKRGRIRYGVLSAVSIAAAVVIKTNCEIALIALLVVLIMSILDDSKIGNNSKSTENSKDGKDGNEQIEPSFGGRILSALIVGALLLIITFVSKAAVNQYYCNLTGLEAIPDGSPSWSHIAMGLQNEGGLEPGWYNRYNYDVFAENGFDTEATARAAKENIKETLLDFAHRPLHAGKFFLRKFTTQWADSVCISTHNLDLVSRHVDKDSALRDYLVFGSDKGCPVLIWIMNVFMPVCYIGVAVYLWAILSGKSVSHQEMLILILIFGGIVFHEFWEGSSRYAMRYYIYWLPYAAYGLKKIVSFNS
ncbi:MAG: hypothetical protein E7308_06460 [Butyrivibrio sp.]|nr:hypothetical protein [Butyrivibrio sp.]